jgi:hypothetical protein
MIQLLHRYIFVCVLIYVNKKYDFHVLPRAPLSLPPPPASYRWPRRYNPFLSFYGQTVKF